MSKATLIISNSNTQNKTSLKNTVNISVAIHLEKLPSGEKPHPQHN